MNATQMIDMTIVSTGYSSGQRIVSVVIEYSDNISADRLSKEDFSVESYPIIDANVSDSIRGGVKRIGRFVQLLLDPENPETELCVHIGRGPQSRLDIKKPRLIVSQLVPIETADGARAEAFSNAAVTKQDRGVADRFLTAGFTTNSGNQLTYHLYAPERVIRGQNYPVVLFMHDAGSCSQDAEATLMQGTGATVWALESDFGRRPCFVVAPHYPTVCANDDFEVTWEADATVELIESLCEQYPIDRKRIYATGQSMGCMMICELLVRNPHFFAGSLLVAGQWSPKRMAAAKDENIWAIVSSGDAKAYPIMGSCMRAMREAGGSLSVDHIDARADAAWLDASVRRQKSNNCNLNFTWFEGRSVIPDGVPAHPGAHHVHTWQKAYDIKALREWLFEQRLYEGKYSYD